MTSSVPDNAHVLSHPCAQAKLSQLRSASTSSKDVQRLVHEIAREVGSAALANALTVTEAGTDKSPLGYTFTRHTITPTSISIVPILRSGLSMVDALLSVLPEPVPVHHLGLYREKSTLQPVEYYNNLPYHRSTDTHPSAGGPSELAIIVDPIIATGATACAAIETLKDWGVKKIIVCSVLATETGLERACEIWKEGVEVWVGGCDEDVDEKGMIKPGLGDIGDRLYLTIGK